MISAELRNDGDEPYVIHSALESVLDKLIADVSGINKALAAMTAAGAPPAAIGALATTLITDPPIIVSNAVTALDMENLKSKSIFGSLE